jgi:hypothetical protein
MTATTTIKAFELIHYQWIAVIHEAIEGFNHFPSVPYLAPIVSGESVVVWNNLDRATDNQAASYLIPALVKLANRYRRDGLSISAADACWLADKFRNSEMTVVGAYLL